MDATLTFTVTDDDTAEAIGSGSLPVLGTPRLLAWCEAATCAAIDPSLEKGSTSVGTRVALDHQGASPVGQEVEVTASSAYVDGPEGGGDRRDHPRGGRLRTVPLPAVTARIGDLRPGLGNSRGIPPRRTP